MRRCFFTGAAAAAASVPLVGAVAEVDVSVGAPEAPLVAAVEVVVEGAAEEETVEVPPMAAEVMAPPRA